MSDEERPIADLTMVAHRLQIVALPGFTLAGGIYRLEITPYGVHPARSPRLTLRELVRLRDDLDREIKAAAGLTR